MKYSKGFLFIVCLTGFLAAPFFLRLNGRYLFNFPVSFPSWSEYLINRPITVDSAVVVRPKQTANLDSINNLVFKERSEIELAAYVDSLMSVSKQKANDSNYTGSPFLINEPIDGVYPLDPFFDKLSTADTSREPVRVGHYGDSQIEGDRMTSTFRRLFAGKFPGGGVGYVPMDDITDPVTYIRSADNSWNRHTVVKNKIAGFAYGPGGSVFRYNPAQAATVKFRLLETYKKAELLYGFGGDSSRMEVIGRGGKSLGSFLLNNRGTFVKLPLGLSSNELDLTIRFTGPSPCVYGLIFDGAPGIQFDNFGLRGQAGDGLMLIPQSQLSDMLTKLNTRLAVLQFGGNVVPGLRTERMLQTYGEIYKNLYLHFKKSMDNPSVLVIGVNDVSRAVNGQYVSYPNISELRYLQRKAAIENGMAFFDIYELMGGVNSIKIWNEKGLAAKDGHFSDKGREIVCREIYQAMIGEYLKYLKRQNEKSK